MNSDSKEPNKLNIPDSTPDPEKLQGMEFLAKMRATADKFGIPFLGGFKDPKTGEIFINSNVNEDDPFYQQTRRKLRDFNPEQ